MQRFVLAALLGLTLAPIAAAEPDAPPARKHALFESIMRDAEERRQKAEAAEAAAEQAPQPVDNTAHDIAQAASDLATAQLIRVAVELGIVIGAIVVGIVALRHYEGTKRREMPSERP